MDWEVPGGVSLEVGQCRLNIAGLGLKSARPLPSLWLIGATDAWAMTVAAHRIAARRPDATAIAPGVVINVAPPASAVESSRRQEYLAGSQTRSFIKTLIDDVIPRLTDDHALDPRGKTIAGHSLAGRFALEVALSQRGVFRRAVAMSPSLWHDGTGIEYLMPEGGDVELLLTVGEYEEALAQWERGQADAATKLDRRRSRGMVAGVLRLADLARQNGVRVDAMVIPEADHATVQAASLTPMLRFAFPPE